MILLDTGPIVALFDPADDSHRRCAEVLKSIAEPLGTTTPVLTEAFHLLSPGSVGAENLIHFIADGGLAVWFLDPKTLDRAFELMRKYADRPMNLADARSWPWRKPRISTRCLRSVGGISPTA
jgi:predicted nucleic acid-binding protein